MFKTKLAVAAGMFLMAGIAQAGLLDATVLIDRAANSRTLTVRYSGVSAALIELRIKGVSVATRSVNEQAENGETSFAIDTASLEDGENPVEIRLYNTDGKVVGSQKSVITVDRRGTGPVFMEKPSAGSTIAGLVEIKLGLRMDMRDIYVSFFINDEFKSLRNFPPYTYLWDTESAFNGWHEVQAWVVDKQNNTFKTEKLRLFVNNAGGRTNRRGVDTNPTTTANNPAAGTMKGTKAPDGGAQATGLEAVVSPATIGGPTKLTPTKTGAASPVLSSNPVKASAGAMMLSKPADTGEGLSTGPQILRADMKGAAPIVIARNVSTAATTSVAAGAEPKLAPVAINYGRRLPNIGSFSVMVDGKFVDFDVSPRVQDGVPLSPFRHLFEEAGGTVFWRHSSKEVQAHGLGKELLFKIGSDIASVNGSQVKFELAPFLESSRVLVPMSFLVDSLKVRVDYDPNTGHVLVTTKDAKSGS